MNVEQLAAELSSIPTEAHQRLAKYRIADLKKKLVVKRFIPSNIVEVKIAESVLDIPTLIDFHNDAKENPLTVSVVISKNTRANEYTTELAYPDVVPGAFIVKWTRSPNAHEYADQFEHYERMVEDSREYTLSQILKFEKFIGVQ